MEITIPIPGLDSQVAILAEEMKELKQLIKNLIKTHSNQPGVISIDEVSRLTGYAKNSIYQYVHQGTIPYHKAEHGGRKLIFVRAEIENWIKGRKPETNEEFCDRKETELCNHYNGGLK